MATSIAPIAAPNAASAAPNETTSQANAGPASVAAQASVAVPATRRLPKRTMSQPLSGMATSEPAPSPASAAPSMSVDRSSVACTAGIRDTQVAKREPVDEEQGADGGARGTSGRDRARNRVTHEPNLVHTAQSAMDDILSRSRCRADADFEAHPMPTLADLTLRLSRDITRNEHERATALAALDGERDAALAALPGARTLLQRRETARAKAETDRAEAWLDIEADLREAEREATARRRSEEDEAEQRLRAADDQADEKRGAAEDKAKAAFEAASLDIERRKLTPGDKVLARAEARRIMDRAFDAARDALAEARLANQDRLLDERRAAAGAELAASQEARAKAAGRRRAADQACELAIGTCDAALQAGLALLPEASALTAAFAERRRGIERRFDEHEARLHADFRRARDELRVG